MAISREEARNIGKEAAKRQLSSQCIEIGLNIESVREHAIDPLHTHIYDYSVALSRASTPTSSRASAEVATRKHFLLQSLNRAQDAVKQTIIDTGYVTPEDASILTYTLKELPNVIERGNILVALNDVEEISDALFHLMLEKVVECECSKK